MSTRTNEAIDLDEFIDGAVFDPDDDRPRLPLQRDPDFWAEVDAWKDYAKEALDDDA